MLQKSCIDFTIEARPLERYMPSKRGSLKYKVWRIVVSTPFEYFIMALIVLNTLLLMMKVCIKIVFLNIPDKYLNKEYCAVVTILKHICQQRTNELNRAST